MKQPELGQKIVALRKEKGLTQEELVKKCNINVRTLQRIESGEVNPRSFTIKIIFETLGYDASHEASNTNQTLLSSLKKSIQQLDKQFQKTNLMKNPLNFFRNYFLAVGIIWFFCALSIIIFNLHFREKEILLTILIPLAFFIFKKVTEKKTLDLSEK
jgi:transcriptional regulator with XRE-family HTH domain